MRLFIDAMWSPAGKELTSWLSFVMSNCSFVTFTQNIENQEITSAKYTVLMLYVCQNERKKAFGRSPPYHNTRSKDVQRLERWFEQTGISFDAQDRSTYGNKTIKLHSRTDVSGLSMQLDATLLNVSYHTIKKQTDPMACVFIFILSPYSFRRYQSNTR